MDEPPKDAPLDPCIDQSEHVFTAIAVPPRYEHEDHSVRVFCTRCGRMRDDLDPVERYRNHLRLQALIERMGSR